MANIEHALLASRSHVQIVDPSLTALFVQEGYIQNFINTAMLALLVYSSSCVHCATCTMLATNNQFFVPQWQRLIKRYVGPLTINTETNTELAHQVHYFWVLACSLHSYNQAYWSYDKQRKPISVVGCIFFLVRRPRLWHNLRIHLSLE